MQRIFIHVILSRHLNVHFTDTMRLSDVIIKGREDTRCTLFPLTTGFSAQDFPARFLMRQHPRAYKGVMYSFSFTRFLSQWVLSSKVLTRHNPQMDIQGGVLQIILIQISISIGYGLQVFQLYKEITYLTVCLTLTMIDLKLDMYLQEEEPQFHGVQLSRRSQRLNPTMQKFQRYMKQVENVFGLEV